MERQLYNWAAGLVALAGLALALHMLAIENSIPAAVWLGGRQGSRAISRHYYVAAILLNAILLPAICMIVAFVAHMGQEVDVVSWFFVAGFYAAISWLWWESSRATLAAQLDPSQITVIRPVSNPLALLGFAVVASAGFWKWKQNWDS